MTNYDRMLQMCHDLHIQERATVFRLTESKTFFKVSTKINRFIFLSGGQGQAMKFVFSLKGRFLNNSLVSIPNATNRKDSLEHERDSQTGLGESEPPQPG